LGDGDARTSALAARITARHAYLSVIDTGGPGWLASVLKHAGR